MDERKCFRHVARERSERAREVIDIDSNEVTGLTDEGGGGRREWGGGGGRGGRWERGLVAHLLYITGAGIARR